MFQLNEADKYQLLQFFSAGITAQQATRIMFGEDQANNIHIIKEINDYYNTIVDNQVEIEEDELNISDGRAPKVLLLDIETAPAISYHWGRWKINVGVSQVIQRPYLITWAAKWLGAPNVMVDMLPAYEGFEDNPRDDYPIVLSLWKLLDEADIVIGHYIKRFDIPQMNARFVLHGLPPPSPYKVVCTKELASKHFKFEANSLAELADHLGVGNKLKMDFDDWRGCVEGLGTPQAWEKMSTYNGVDVEVLEQVYLKLRPFDTRHPNVSLYYGGDKPRCTVCGSENLEKLEKNTYTMVSEFESYRCECGHVSRSRYNLRDKVLMKNTLTNAQYQ